jgi:hypothetical protein
MARERLADLDESKEDERERKLKLQEKNRRAQQAFRWRQKVRSRRFQYLRLRLHVGYIFCALGLQPDATTRASRMCHRPACEAECAK